MDAVAVGVALVAYNAVLNRQSWFQGHAYLAANVAAGAALLALALGPFGLDAATTGLGGRQTLWISLALVAAGAALIAAFAKLRPGAPADPRMARWSEPGAAAFYVLVRIPVGTALFEELAFRGVLFGLLAGRGSVFATIWSSVAFGLWHVEPTRIAIRVREPDAPRRVVVAGVAVGVIATGIAGAGFCWLRVVSGGIWSTVILHAGFNSVAAAASIAALRRGSPSK